MIKISRSPQHFSCCTDCFLQVSLHSDCFAPNRSQEAIVGWKLVVYAARLLFCFVLLEVMSLGKQQTNWQSFPEQVEDVVPFVPMNLPWRLHSCPVWAIGRSSLYLKVQRPDLLAHLGSVCIGRFWSQLVHLAEKNLSPEKHQVLCYDDAHRPALNTSRPSRPRIDRLAGKCPEPRRCGWSFWSFGVSLVCGPFVMELKLLKTCSAVFATWLKRYQSSLSKNKEIFGTP